MLCAMRLGRYSASNCVLSCLSHFHKIRMIDYLKYLMGGNYYSDPHIHSGSSWRCESRAINFRLLDIPVSVHQAQEKHLPTESVQRPLWAFNAYCLPNKYGRSTDSSYRPNLHEIGISKCCIDLNRFGRQHRDISKSHYWRVSVDSRGKLEQPRHENLITYPDIF